MAFTAMRPVLASGALFIALIALVPSRDVMAQRTSSAEGPWSGQVQCVVVGKFEDYLDEQTHTWRLTGEPPTPAARGSAQVYFTWPATWTVKGSGRKTWPSREPVVGGREQTERWTIAHEMKMSLRFTEVGSGTNRLRIGTEGQRGAPLGSLRVTEVSGRTREGSVQQWAFPAIEDSASNTTISGTSTRTYPEGFGVGPGQPPRAITTATCTWHFTRGGVEQISATPPAGGQGVRYVPGPVAVTLGLSARGTWYAPAPVSANLALSAQGHWYQPAPVTITFGLSATGSWVELGRNLR
jgi:hypothetical protein